MSVEFQRPSGGPGAINLTPLIDVIFQLLIFFMLTSSFVYPALDMDLPRAERAERPSDPQHLVISVSTGGDIHLNQQKVPDGRLEELLRLELSIRSDRTVFFRADRAMPYERFVEIMDTATRAGARSFHLIHETSE